MLGRNIKKYRMLSGMSLRALANQINVSHETIKKYEDEILVPNSSRLIALAKVLNVNVSDLLNNFAVPQLQFTNFRKQQAMTKTKEQGLCLLISDEIAKYLEILDYANEKYTFDKSKWSFNVESIKDLEKIAKKVREYFGISDDCPLDNLTDKLEDNNFLIIKINYEDHFDGFCEITQDLAFIILSSKGYERNRFTLAHELGHLILNFKENLNEKEIEHYCDLFASALLLPEKAMKHEFVFNGYKLPRNISLMEIILTATEYQVSPNSVIMRLNSLGMIDDIKKSNLFILLSKRGLKNAQLKNVNEKPMRMNKIIFRLEAENIISSDEAIKYLGVTTDEYLKRNFSD